MVGNGDFPSVGTKRFEDLIIFWVTFNNLNFFYNYLESFFRRNILIFLWPFLVWFLYIKIPFSPHDYAPNQP